MITMIKTGNSVGAEGAKMISETLKRNRSLNTLWLGGEEKGIEHEEIG